MTLTVDANVWIAAYDPRDKFHTPSSEFLMMATQLAQPLNGPSFVLAETSCALARRTRKASAGQSAQNLLRGQPFLTLHPVNDTLLAEAIRLGTQYLVRGADALYVATAALTNAQLLSWDEELIQRANAITPADWLTANRQRVVP